MKKAAVTIVKLGGAVLENRLQRDAALDRLAALSGARILVHGGGRAASALADRLGIASRMVDGRRITDREMLEVVTMVYGGLGNRTLVAELQARGCDACGCTGADFNLIRAAKRKVAEIDYGFVGDIEAVNTPALMNLLTRGVLPVLAPLTHDGTGTLLNTNADTIASSVAAALAGEMQVSLLYCFDRGGVSGSDGNIISHITSEIAEKMIQEKAITAGMLPKLDNAFAALRAGVMKVCLCAVEDIEAIASGREGKWTEVEL